MAAKLNSLTFLHTEQAFVTCGLILSLSPPPSPVPNQDQCRALVQTFLSHVDTPSLSSFSELFLLQSNSSPLRWQAHQLLHCLYQYCGPSEQLTLVEVLWGLWPSMPDHGHKAAQFVDLLGYLTISTPQVLQKVNWEGVGGKGRERVLFT